MNKTILLLFLLISSLFSGAQQQSWNTNQLDEIAFVKNEGQFDGRNWKKNDIEFAVTQNPYYIFFTKEGLTYRMDKFIKNKNRVKEDPNSPKRMNVSEFLDVVWVGSNPNVQIIADGKTNHYYSYAIKDHETREISNINRVNGFKKITYKELYPNIDVEYFFHKDGGVKYSIILHPGADPSVIQMKYTTKHTNVLNESTNLKLNAQGQLEMTASLGKITEHKPYTYYQNSKQEISSHYQFSNNIVTFNLGNYDNSREVVIDPWMVIETFNSSNAVWEVENDGSGNTYVTGGETPMVLKKYNAAGTLQWTYNTPWDTATVWLGTLATDQSGNSFVTSGVTAEMHKVDNAGNFIWQSALSGGLQFNSEWWSITFNCDETKLIVGGTWVNGLLSFDFYGGIFDIDVNTGTVLNDMKFTHVNIGGIAIPPPTPIEVRSISSAKNSQYIFLTHDSVGAINQDFSSCPNNGPYFQVDNTHHLAYKCENYLPKNQNGGGLKALVSNDNYFYTHRGDRILQWDVNTGALLNNVALPGGSSGTSLGERIVHCSGLDVDVNGNVYAGSMDRVVKFDANLNFVSQALTTNGFTVYDVSVNSNGEVVAGGAEGNNQAAGNRVGRVQAFNMSATGQYALVCCDPLFCQIGPLCITDAPVNLNPNTGGGTWSVSPATPALNTGTGVFDPSLATAGTYTITYTIGCGSHSITVSVGNCSVMSVCKEANGDLTVTGGTGPYNWFEWTAAQTITTNTSANCTACGGTWTFGSCYNPFPIPLNSCTTPAGWSPFGTGTTVTPPGSADTIKVVDSFGDTIVYYGISTIPPCSGCDATITQAGPFCENAGATNLTAAQSGGTWSGTGITNSTNGTFDPSVAGPGSHVITYTLTGCNDTVTIVVNPLPDAGTNGTVSICAGASAINLIDSLGGTPDAGGSWSGPSALTGGDQGTFNPASNTAGTYTYTVTNGCGSVNSTVTVTINPSPDAGSNGTASLCSGGSTVNLIDSLGGTPNAGGSWSGPSALTGGDQGTFNPASNTAGTYTYTVTNTCGTANSTVTVTINPAPNAGGDSTLNICPTSAATDLFNYLVGTPDNGGTWSGPSALANGDLGTFNPASNTAGTYTYTVTNSCGTSTANIVVTILANPTPGSNGTVSICANASNINLIDSLTGSPSTGGSWSGPSALTGGDQGTFNPASNTAGTYTYTVLDCNNNPQTATVTVTINPAPDAGGDSTLTICPTAAATDLFNYLSGTPDNGGTWSGPSALANGDLGTFNPASNSAGTYTYTVTNACGTSTANIVVTILANPTPGSNGTVSICANASSINLIDSLTGSPSAGGTWTGPSTLTGGDQGTFNPASNTAGTYTYTILDCSNNPQTATVTVTINPAPDAGGDSTLSICPTAAATDLFNYLSGTPDNGGTWSGPSALANGDQGTFNPASNAAGMYTYTVTNACGTSTANVTVTISSNPTPGSNGSVTICANASNINLIDSLTGSPSAGGTWTGPSTLTGGDQGTFNPASNTAGTYTYTVLDCNNNPQTATVTVTVNPAPDAGTNGSITMCATDPAVDLFTLLGGTPDLGGTWSPAMNSGTGVFDPSLDAAGVYTYTVTNTCGTSSATVTVTVNPCTMPTAGYSVSDSAVCAGECITFTDQSTGATGWQWTFTGGTPSSANTQGPHTVCYDTDGTYNVELIVTNSNGSDTTTSTVTIHPLPIIDAGSDVTIELGQSANLNATGSNGVYTWTPPTWLDCVVCTSPVSTPTETITYTVVVVDSNGCTASDDVTVIVDFDYVIWVPNIFSPNGDGNNDIVFVRGAGVQTLKFFIYDRWGEKVFETTDMNIGWDGTFRGKKMNNAVFVYYLEATFLDGSEVTKKGDITLVR
ncbi:MAG: gliding motility-associated C-terminal domain-containing protein [Flavobacteriales bacterium]|nr:gliding motility-associated C-terminal domain-containing protein [Flavobacteriales bacterium]